MLVRYIDKSAASGSMGGQTASHNRGGMYLRARAVPTNPGSQFQQDIRTIFSGLTTRWQVITALQREAWTTYAINVPVLNRMGDPIILTGQQMYIRCNSARIQAGLPVVDDGPTVFAMDSLSIVSITPTDTSEILGLVFDNTDEWANEDDAALLAYGARQQALTINYFRGPYRFAGKIDGDSITPPTSPAVSVINPFEFDVGNAAFARVLSVRADGRISPVQFIGPTTII